MSSKTLVFAVAGYNLAETGRMMEIARKAKDHFNIVFLSYGGRFEDLIAAQGFAIRHMQPRLTAEKLRHLQKVLSGQTFNTLGYFTADELRMRVKNELTMYEEVAPVAIVTGWCLSALISARIAKIPIVNVLHSTTISEYYWAGLQSIPDRASYPFMRWIFGNDEDRLNRWVSKVVLKASSTVRAFNAVGAEYGLAKFSSIIEVIEGDHVLLADIPEWVGFARVRDNVHYIGPLPTRLDLPVPQAIASLPHDRPIVYFAMGSSGKPELIANILRGFAGKPYRVIAPVKGLVESLDVNVPENVLLTDLVPAHKVNPLADVAVIHGGQNTVMNACLSGTPIVGIGMHPEQQANLDACVRKGFAVRLNKKWSRARDVLDATDTLLGDTQAKQRILEFKALLEKWDGPENGARFLAKTFG